MPRTWPRLTRRAVAVTAGTATALVLGPWALAAHADPGPSASPSASPTTTPADAASTATRAAPTPSATTTPPASSTPRPRAATGDAPAGAAYLVRQLAGSDHLASSYNGQTYVDYGGTIDVALALASTGTQDGTLARLLGYLDAHVGDDVDPGGTQGGPYGGAAGKLALLEEVTGQNPRDVSGVDLLDILTGTVCTAATKDGACTAAGDFHGAYSGLGQVLPVLALARAHVAVPAAALTRLGQLQCADGGFSSELLAPGAACTSDVDTTGAALQALMLLPSQAASADEAARFLLAAQQPDGGFVGAAGENANSTALAVQGLLADPSAAGSGAAVTRGQAFLASLQQADGGLKVSATSSGSDLRATDQAVPALAGRTLTTLTDPVTPVAPPPAAPSSPAPSTTPAGAPTPAAGGTTGTVGSHRTTAATGALPYTGEDTVPWLQAGAGLLLAGTALLGAGGLLRRRRAPR